MSHVRFMLMLMPMRMPIPLAFIEFAVAIVHYSVSLTSVSVRMVVFILTRYAPEHMYLAACVMHVCMPSN